MPHHTGTIGHLKKLDEHAAPQLVDEEFRKSGFALQDDNINVRLFLHEHYFRKAKGIQKLKEKERRIAVIVNCEGEKWYVHSAPAGGDDVELSIVVPKSGGEDEKTIASGTGHLVADSAGREGLKFEIATLYDMIRSSPKENSFKVSGEGGVKGGQPYAQATVSYEVKW